MQQKNAWSVATDARLRLGNVSLLTNCKSLCESFPDSASLKEHRLWKVTTSFQLRYLFARVQLAFLVNGRIGRTYRAL